MNLLTQLLELVYPTRCLVCQEVGAVVHPACRAKLSFLQEPFCHQCALPLRVEPCPSPLCQMPEADRYLTGLRSVLLHRGGGREAVLRLKYRGVASLAEWAGTESGQALHRFRLAEHFDLVMPVPLHPDRLRKRGYNQAALVAVVLARRLGRPYREGLLMRRRATRSQVELNGQERAANMRDAFGWSGQPLAGQRVLLFDDVCTTGATLNECARAVRAAGAAEVWALTLTREVFQAGARS